MLRWFRGVRNNMKTTKAIYLLSIGLFLMIFLINVVNAQTLVAGKIYNSGYSDIISGADITVTCNSNVLDTTSLDDGTYAVRFNQTECDLRDNVNVNGVQGDLSGSASGVVIACNNETDTNCAEGYVSIINLAIKSQQSSGSHVNLGGSRYYNCGNGKCDSGESINTCPRDCKVIINQNVTTDPNANNENNENNQTQTLTTNLEEDNQTTNQGGLSKITGAVVGTLGTGWIVIIIFIVGVLALSLIVRFVRKKKTITETI